MYFKIIEYIQAFKSKIAPIPFLLRIVALCFLCFSLFIIAIIPFSDMNYTLNGVSMTYSDFMKTKAPWIFVSVGIICPICGYTILNRIKWGRFLMLGSYMIPSIILPILSMKEFVNIINVLPSLLFSLVIYWYLFLNENVRNYYNFTEGIN
jgi:hypothetical protein